MRRSLALFPAVCLLAITACDSSAEDSEGPAETVAELAEEGLTGLALLHRGFEGGDPESDQVLVFHDPDTGQPVQRIHLPDGAVDPMAPALPVHAQFSEDWQFFAFASTEPNAIHVAALADPEEADVEEISYVPVEAVTPAAGETLSKPAIHGERLWFVSMNEQSGQPPQVQSVPLDAPGGTPNQEGSLALGENNRPSDWVLTPGGALHIRNSVQIRQLIGSEGSSLVMRETDGNIVNATLTINGGQWQTFDEAQVWGGGTALVRPDDLGGDVPNGAYLVSLDNGGQGHTPTRLLESGDGPVVQFAPAPERDAVLLQTATTWFRIGLEEGSVTETEEAFPRFHDASMDGWPLVVRWAQEPPEDASEEPSESPSP